jgi:Trp operon repressor
MDETGLPKAALAHVDLVGGARRLEDERQALTIRAQLYLASGVLTQAQVLNALGISRATWYRRVAQLEQARADAAAEVA